MSNKTRELIQTLQGDKRKLSELKFPLNLDTEGTGNVIRFTMNLPSRSTYLSNGQYKTERDPATGKEKTSVVNRSGSNSLRKRFSHAYKRTTSQIDLFMPAQIRSSYQSDWGQEELGVAGSVVDAAYGISGINDMEGAKEAWGVIKNTIPEALFNTLSSAGSILTQTNVKGARKLASNTMVNPYVEVLFNGIQNRTFSFTFKLIPRNSKEQSVIRDIVNEFKFHRAPELKFSSQSNYWLFPSTFDISFLNRQGENPWLFKISTCALTNFSVDYSPDGSNASHADGAPFAVEMTMEFTELEQIDKRRAKEGY